MKDLSMRRSSLFLAVVLAACGDNSGTSVGATDSGSATEAATTDTTATTVSPTVTTEEPTGGSMGHTDSQATTSTTVTPEPTSTTTESTTDTTTMGVVTETTTTTTDDTTTTTTSTTTTTDTESTTDDTTTGQPEPCACPDIEVPLDDGIFVLSDNAELWKYYPESNDFALLGNFNCGGNTNMFSMAVDRLGYAWVMLNSPAGDIWKIDVTNPTNCIDPGYTPNQQGVGYFGMAFVSNSAVDQCDRLYGNTYDGLGGFSEGPNIGKFVTLDPDSLLIDIISPTNFNGAEMSGTGDGRVFSFGGVPSKLVERNKQTGEIVSTLPLNNLPLTNAFAFAFFAGDFYFFTESDNNNLISKVTHLDYDDSDNDGQQQLTVVNTAAPLRVVGAGVSTCAPLVPM
jgi:hypothetical protein